MADLEHQRFATDPGINQFTPDPARGSHRAVYEMQGMEAAPLGQLAYSSPRPWMLGLTVSLGMWGAIGWLIWAYLGTSDR
jgi:hypothetical protein